ncbi:MAG: bifunctional [glutamate--ammonia ligase]-adenylyl-L-tyrosine phosphorylase/[glutamate--ammonia-ligase] adenylyltransferase [Nitrospirae bacterium]|nr:bifunctional [glutamate--ammonia ligase]-adenylyl-L-tyrosine phosphorylase/[glutamate--ammonia-ligase] adenylyltransferase [Nitrospirota bacterium]
MLRLTEVLSDREFILPYLKEISRLFAVSRFLANFCISHPDELFSALEEIEKPIVKDLLLEKGRACLSSGEDADTPEMMKNLRIFKNRNLLRITLRNIMAETDTPALMDELSQLAEAVIDFALQYSLRSNIQRFGRPSSEELAVIALGKLGGEELNYSSDIDLMAVYGTEEGHTSGVLSPSGVRINRLSNHEFYCKVMEVFNRVLSQSTEDGIAYRVDLRLRPQGQKGDIALPLAAYRTYYETWGRTWERMAMIRARPVSGSMHLGKEFMKMIEPFVWRRPLDYSEIEEIKALKKRIDSVFSKDDIKRGYGGIMEAEFFIQTFQLIYGYEYTGLRTHRLLNAAQSLRWLGIIPEEDLVTLCDNYMYLRKLEHFLQMKDDLRTHSLPAANEDMVPLGKLMGFTSAENFLSDLRVRRMKTKNMYNSLLGTEEDVYAEALSLLEGNLSDNELAEYLSFRGIKYTPAGLVNLKGIREQFSLFKTRHERTVIRKIVPRLLEKALKSESPDRAIKGLENLFATLGMKETYLTGFMERRELEDGIISLFSLSTYLSRLFLSSPRYLDLLIEGSVIRKSLSKTEEELKRVAGGHETGMIEYKNAEDIRLGSFFLMKVINVINLTRYMSHLAEAVLKIRTEGACQAGGFSVIGLGKLGGRELTFGSDLDMIFLSEIPDGIKIAEKIIKGLTSYADKGRLYNVDMGLRPDGSKGVLLNDMEGYRDYYLKSAHPWEIQALVKARPVAGDKRLTRAFADMTREIIVKRGVELKIDDVRAMRLRIIKELSHESKGMDIKLGPGGIGEIEFIIQWLQLQNAAIMPEVMVQDTLSAIRRLMKGRIISIADGGMLLGAYRYLRTLETCMRLNEEHFISGGSEFTELAAVFMGHKEKAVFMEHIENLRHGVTGVIEKMGELP